MLVDCITGLPIFELTTTADVADSTVAIDILSQTNSFLPVNECTFIADKAYDVKAIYSTVKDIYEGDCVIPLNKRNTKNPKKLSSGHPICEAGLAMNIDRNCISFKKIYSLRTEAERYNARFKQTGQERLWVHSENAAKKNLNTIAHIALLAVAYAAFITKSNHSVRCLKSTKGIA